MSVKLLVTPYRKHKEHNEFHHVICEYINTVIALTMLEVKVLLQSISQIHIFHLLMSKVHFSV